jgi:transmembrane sensor
MSEADPIRGRARKEASDWFARLKRRQVSLTDLEAFRAWREDPDNRAAYDTLDDTWRLAGTLGGEAATRQAVSDALKRGAVRRSRQERRSAWMTGAGVTAVLLLTAGAGAALWVSAHPTFATGVGEQRLVRLADGSTVRLDTDSRIAVDFSGNARRVVLERGQALFDIVHDPARPFQVAAGALSVQDVGTRFDVRAVGPTASVTLLEGAIAVTRQGGQPQRWTLRPGEQVTAAAAATPKTVDVAAATSWTSGRVVFQDVPLSAAVAEVNRYSVHKIVLNAPTVAGTPVSGSFDTGDAAAFVAAESGLHGLRATRQADGTIVLDAAQPAAE